MSFYRVSFGFTGFYWVFTEFKGVLSGFTDFQRVLQACTEFYWAFTGLYLALLGFAGFLPGFPVTWCISCAVAGDFDDFFWCQCAIQSVMLILTGSSRGGRWFAAG